MLAEVKELWKTVQDFLKRIDDVEDESEETKKEVRDLRRNIETMARELRTTQKVQDHQSKEIVDLEARIKKLESEKHGLAIKAGKAKAKVSRMKAEQTKQ
jgi:septal ring factor EnvC (AmiA/AmiB activator)